MSVIREPSCNTCNANCERLSLSIVPKPMALGSVTPNVSNKLLTFANECQARYLPQAESMAATRLTPDCAHADVPPNELGSGLQTMIDGNLALRATWLKDTQSNALCAEIPLSHVQHSLATNQVVRVAVPNQMGSFHFTTDGYGIKAIQYQAN